MEIAPSLSRIWRLALVGASTAFAWLVISLLLGLGSAPAHAVDDDGNGNGLMGALTSVVDVAASAVTGTVTTVTGSVDNVAATVVAVAPAPVQQPVREVVGTVDAVVATTTAPVTDVVSGGAVGAVTQPIIDVVTAVPIVGTVVSVIGVDDAATELAETADDTLGGLVGAIEDTGSAIGLPPGITPVVPGLDVPDVLSVLEVGATIVGAPVPAAAALHGDRSVFDRYAALPRLSADSAVISASSALSGGRAALPSAGGLCPPTFSSSGPGGTGSGAWALVALGPLATLRAWVRRAGPEDELEPPAPAGSTDVSPD